MEQPRGGKRLKRKTPEIQGLSGCVPTGLPQPGPFSEKLLKVGTDQGDGRPGGLPPASYRPAGKTRAGEAGRRLQSGPPHAIVEKKAWEESP